MFTILNKYYNFLLIIYIYMMLYFFVILSYNFDQTLDLTLKNLNYNMEIKRVASNKENYEMFVIIRLSPVAYTSSYLYSNSTLRIIQSIMQNIVLNDHISELLNTIFKY
jgi:hypothetical protein